MLLQSFLFLMEWVVKEPFLLKNITEDPIQVEVVLAGMEEPITTTIYSGWNVELVKQVNNAVADTLQYGY